MARSPSSQWGRVKNRARNKERAAAHRDGREPRPLHEVYCEAGVPEEYISGTGETHTGGTAGHRDASTTGPYSASHLKPRYLGNGQWSDPGLVASPDEPYGSLMPLWPGQERRRHLPVSVSIRADFLEEYGLKRYGAKRDHIRTAKRGHAAYPQHDLAAA